MFNLYQSPPRLQLHGEILGKTTLRVPLGDQIFTAIVKSKKTFGITRERIQILGLEFEKFQNPHQILSQLREFCRARPGCVFVQLGLIDELFRTPNATRKIPEFFSESRAARLALRQQFQRDFGLQPSFRENMPESTIVIDLTLPPTQLSQNFNSTTQRRVRRAEKSGMKFRELRRAELDNFYALRQRTANSKNFSVLPRAQFDRLASAFFDQNLGKIFITELDAQITAASCCLIDRDTSYLTYLYGFANRDFAKLGGNHFLKSQIFLRGQQNWITRCDLLGGAPTGFPDHELAGVSQFKEWLGGQKIDIFGNFDLPLRPVFYRALRAGYQLHKKHKKISWFLQHKK